MKCDFCGHEVAPGTVECPYCHYQFKIDAQVLSPEEVHTFGCGSGILITFLILCGIVAVIFFLLPTFIVFAAVGAIVLFIMRLFMGF